MQIDRSRSSIACNILLKFIGFAMLFDSTALTEIPHEPSTVTIAFIVRNGAATLPWFLGSIENLDYPKDRISIWCRSDHNEDGTENILKEWGQNIKNLYHSINISIEDSKRYPFEEKSGVVGSWSLERYKNVIFWRQQALEAARNLWSDYILMVDADVFIADRWIIQHLILEDKTLVAPMMNSTSLYSNFWGAIDERGYYRRSDDYLSIYHKHIIGTFQVPMVHSIYLLNLRHLQSKLLAYSPAHPDYPNEVDDVMQFAFSAKVHGIPWFVTNKHYFGYLIPPKEDDDYFTRTSNYSLYIRLKHISDGMPFQVSKHITYNGPAKTKLGFDQVYMLNLVRRPERFQMMDRALKEIGIDYKYFPAVDGRALNISYLEQLGVQQLPGYLDPYHKRPMKMGEIGCFLSHYFMWKEMEEKNYSKILIFEDDVRFHINFIRDFYQMMDEVNRHHGGWDLLYIGRKIMQHNEEFVPNSRYLVYPGYTYWTLSYALSRRGMQKLLAQNPLSKMLPVDEFLPIMFDSHTNEEWRMQFYPRNIIALSANPLLVEPLKYIGDSGYVSDTEDSSQLQEQKQNPSTIKAPDNGVENWSDNQQRHATTQEPPTVLRPGDEL